MNLQLVLKRHLDNHLHLHLLFPQLKQKDQVVVLLHHLVSTCILNKTYLNTLKHIQPLKFKHFQTEKSEKILKRIILQKRLIHRSIFPKHFNDTRLNCRTQSEAFFRSEKHLQHFSRQNTRFWQSSVCYVWWECLQFRWTPKSTRSLNTNSTFADIQTHKTTQDYWGTNTGRLPPRLVTISFSFLLY